MRLLPRHSRLFSGLGFLILLTGCSQKANEKAEKDYLTEAPPFSMMKVKPFFDSVYQSLASQNDQWGAAKPGKVGSTAKGTATENELTYPSIMDGYSPISVKPVKQADLNGDGLEDVAVLMRYDGPGGGNNFEWKYFFFVMRPDVTYHNLVPEAVDRKYFGRITTRTIHNFELTDFNKDNTQGWLVLYKPEDEACCPTDTVLMKLLPEDGKLGLQRVPTVPRNLPH